MWGIEHDEIKSMAKTRRNSAYLPDASFPDPLQVTNPIRPGAEYVVS